MAKSIKQQVRELEQRVDRAMPLSKFIARTQINQLMKAERLRRVCLNLWREAKKPAPGTRELAVVPRRIWREFGKLVLSLSSFHSYKGRIPKAVLKMLKD